MTTEGFRFVVEFGYEFMPLPFYLHIYDAFDIIGYGELYSCVRHNVQMWHVSCVITCHEFAQSSVFRNIRLGICKPY
jgi:hypothetical protein